MTRDQRQITFLTLPGIYSSGPEHWQTRWEASDPRFRRVQQDDWEHPRPRAWVANIVAAVEATPPPIVFVAHSLGCHAVARASNEPVVAQRVAAALLVAPPDLDDERNSAYDMADFLPMVARRLPFQSLGCQQR
ncbi:MAG: alpha/beta hydrolase [Chloroflexota bacterium]|nr:alpha/beta hydrolase [Chloroflexota bacterium]